MRETSTQKPGDFKIHYYHSLFSSVSKNWLEVNETCPFAAASIHATQRG